MLDERLPALDSDSPGSAVGSAGSRSSSGPLSASGPRSARKKKGLFRRTGIILPATGVAALLVAVVMVASYLESPNGTGASSLFGAIDNLSHSGSVSLLEQERQTIVEMDAASKTLTVDAKPTMASPAQVLAAQSAAQSQSSATSETGGTTVNTPAAPANPSGAEAIGKSMLTAFGFNQTTQWTCLYNLWTRESGWNVYAENPSSGAYGIPQSLPGSKMESAGSDWETNPATQIKWGLGYIQSVYGTPCGAWDNELAYGSY
jgi:hypothetical protein